MIGEAVLFFPLKVRQGYNYGAATESSRKKIINKSVNADRNPGRRNLYEDTKILRRLERAEIKTIRERRKRQTTKTPRSGSGIRFFAVEYRRIQYRYRFQNA